jgi:hypothetical protein
VVSLRLFVEGGGDGKTLRTACRAGFAAFLRKAGIPAMPRIVASGSRENAFSDFRTAIDNGQPALLLVDSEAPVADAHQQGDPATWKPWAHLTRQDGWQPPAGATDADCHLMVQCMEAWLVAVPETLRRHFGQCFKPSALPATRHAIEAVPTSALYQVLGKATAGCGRDGRYDKGKQSFRLLEQIDPRAVCSASPWAARFAAELMSR